MEFDWHDDKSEETRRNRGFGFDFVARIFAGRTVEWVDGRRDYGETRINALGQIEGTIYHVTYTTRGEVCWIISARRANRKERRGWQNAR